MAATGSSSLLRRGNATRRVPSGAGALGIVIFIADQGSSMMDSMLRAVRRARLKGLPMIAGIIERGGGNQIQVGVEHIDGLGLGDQRIGIDPATRGPCRIENLFQVKPCFWTRSSHFCRAPRIIQQIGDVVLEGGLGPVETVVGAGCSGSRVSGQRCATSSAVSTMTVPTVTTA